MQCIEQFWSVPLMTGLGGFSFPRHMGVIGSVDGGWMDGWIDHRVLEAWWGSWHSDGTKYSTCLGIIAVECPHQMGTY